MNTLDIIVLAVIALSGLFAFARGFVKEVLSIGAWVGAGFATLYGYPYVVPIARGFITSPQIAGGVAGITLFLLCLIVLSLITSTVARKVKDSGLSALDRTLGLVFGLARGAVLVCLGYLALSWALPEKDWPDWAKGARTRPFLISGAETIKSFVPTEAKDRGAATAAEAQRMVEQAREAERVMKALSAPGAPAAAPAAQPPKPGQGTAPAPAASKPAYKPNELKDMQKLIESNQ